MAELLLVNPRRRKRRKSSSRRRRKSAARRTYRRRRRAVAVAAPRRRRRRSVARVSFRRRRRNPSLRGITGSLKSNLVPALKGGFIGALGGLGVNLVLGQVSSRLPAALQTGWGKVGVKLGAALLVGLAGGYILKGRGRALTEGAMTVTLYDVLKEQFAGVFPSVPLGEYLTYAPVVGYGDGSAALPGSTGMGAYMSGLGEYVTGAGSGVAYDDEYYGGF